MGLLKKSVVLCVVAPDTAEVAQALEGAFELRMERPMQPSGGGADGGSPRSPVFSSHLRRGMAPFTSITWIRTHRGAAQLHQQQHEPISTNGTSSSSSSSDAAGAATSAGGGGGGVVLTPSAVSIAPLSQQLQKMHSPNIFRCVDVLLPPPPPPPSTTATVTSPPEDALNASIASFGAVSLTALPDPIAIVNDPMKRLELQVLQPADQSGAGATAVTTTTTAAAAAASSTSSPPPPPASSSSVFETFSLCVVCDREPLLPPNVPMPHNGGAARRRYSAPSTPMARVTNTNSGNGGGGGASSFSRDPTAAQQSHVPPPASMSSSSSSSLALSSTVQLPQSESVVDLSTGSRDALATDLSPALTPAQRLSALIGALQATAEQRNARADAPSALVSRVHAQPPWRSTLRAAFAAIVRDAAADGSAAKKENNGAVPPSPPRDAGATPPQLRLPATLSSDAPLVDLWSSSGRADTETATCEDRATCPAARPLRNDGAGVATVVAGACVAVAVVLALTHFQTHRGRR